ncbi:ABC transporter permease subunit [Vallitalea okinawensis]|uniref:ABC transporter permease subunit n=1 Tax=Vallitalea okinawensis TaxID=2078660 RepID=UPI000CFDF0B9|nr:ABC transporter permease subunit [Vallitalea okinawensis]
MNIILRELRANRKALIIWCVAMTLFVAVGMVKYSGFANMGEEVNELMASLPEALQKAFGLGSINLTEVGGYYSMFFIYFMLIAGIHASLLGSTIISKEVRDKTADFLMVKPVTRTQVITSKIIAALINVIILNFVTCLSSILFVQYYNTGDSITNLIIQMNASLLIIQLIFLSLGLFISALTRTSKKATSISTAVLLTAYFLSIAISIYEDISFLGYLTPFYYFDAEAIMLGEGIEMIYLFIAIVIIAISIPITYHQYRNKDLHV